MTLRNFKSHPCSQARAAALQFLYQCMCENLFYFSEPHFVSFANHFSIDGKVARLAQPLVAGALHHLTAIDESISNASHHWALERIARTDLCALRIACYELVYTDNSPSIVISEAVNLSRHFGSSQSASFVNGVLDHIMGLRSVEEPYSSPKTVHS